MLTRAENSGAAPPALVVMVASQQKAREFEKPRVRRQRRAHTVAADPEQGSARTALQRLSVTAPTQEQYEKILAKVALWISSRRACPQCKKDWEALVAALMVEGFFEGQSANSKKKLLAAVLWRLPQLPLPMTVVAMLGMEILWSGRPDIAVLVLLMLKTYCRPSKPMRLQGRDVVPGQSKTRRATAILLHPFECRMPATHQQFVQTVLLGLPQHMVFSRAPPSLGPRFHEMGSQIRIRALEAIHPCQLRHTSAARDSASSARSLERIQKRGPNGSARQSRAIANQEWPALRKKLLDGPKEDLELVRNRQLIREWIRAGHARGWHAGVPCHSFSRARDRPGGPPRPSSAAFQKGLPVLVPHDLSRILSLQLSPCRCLWLPQSSWNSLRARHDSAAPSPTKDGLCYAGICWTDQSTTWSWSETASSSGDGSEPDMFEGGTQDFPAKVFLEPETDLVDLPDSEAPTSPTACPTWPLTTS